MQQAAARVRDRVPINVCTRFESLQEAVNKYIGKANYPIKLEIIVLIAKLTSYLYPYIPWFFMDFLIVLHPLGPLFR